VQEEDVEVLPLVLPVCADGVNLFLIEVQQDVQDVSHLPNEFVDTGEEDN
jgi:hypothetical protein